MESAATFEIFSFLLAMMSSFGPVVALASLSNSLNQTLACRGGRSGTTRGESTSGRGEVCGRSITYFEGLGRQIYNFLI